MTCRARWEKDSEGGFPVSAIAVLKINLFSQIDCPGPGRGICFECLSYMCRILTYGKEIGCVSVCTCLSRAVWECIKHCLDQTDDWKAGEGRERSWKVIIINHGKTLAVEELLLEMEMHENWWGKIGNWKRKSRNEFSIRWLMDNLFWFIVGTVLNNQFQSTYGSLFFFYQWKHFFLFVFVKTFIVTSYFQNVT